MSVPAQVPQTPPAASRIDFGWIKAACALSSAQPGVWAGSLFLLFLIYIGVWSVLLFVTGGWPAFQRTFIAGFNHVQRVTYSYPAPTAAVYQRFAVEQVRDIVLAGIDAIFVGGLYRMALRQGRGEPISVSGLFSAFPESVPLFLVGVAMPVVLGLIKGALMWPRHLFLPLASVTLIGNIYLLLDTLLSSLLMFAPLLIVDAGASVPEALRGSMRLLGRHWLRGIWFYLVASVVGGIGVLLCGVGMLVTYPVFLLSITTAYLALTQSDAEAKPFDPVFGSAAEGVWPPRPRVP